MSAVERPPKVIPERCTGCGQCVSACEANAIHLHQLISGHKLSVIDPDRCRLAGDCITACPHGAIDFSR